MALQIYLSGEIHTDWRDQIIQGAKGMDVAFSAPVTDTPPVMIAGLPSLGLSLINFGMTIKARN